MRTLFSILFWIGGLYLAINLGGGVGSLIGFLIGLDFKWYIEYVSLLVGSGTTLLKSNTSENILLGCRAYLRDLRLEELGI